MYNNSYYKYSGMRWWYRNLWWLQITLPCLIILSIAGALLYNWHRQNTNQQRQDEYMEQMWTWWRGNPPQLDPDLDEKTAAWRAIRQKQDDSSFPISHEKKLLIVKHWEYLISGMSIEEVQRLHNLLQDKKPDQTDPNVIDPKKFSAPWAGTLTVDSPSAPNENDASVQDAKDQNSSDDAAKPDSDAAKPESNAAKPESDATKPDSDAAKPDSDAAKPDSDAVKPDDDATKNDPDVAKPDFGAMENTSTSIQQQSAATPEETRPEKSDSSNELKEGSVEAAVDKAVERMVGTYGAKPSNPESTSGGAQNAAQNKAATAEKPDAQKNPPGIKEYPEDSSADSILTQEYIPVDWKL